MSDEAFERYKEDAITEWILGASPEDDATIAQWIAEAAKHGAEGRAAAPPLPSSTPPDESLLLDRKRVLDLLGRISEDSYVRHVLPDLKVTMVGTKQMVARAEIARWISENSARALRGS